MSKSFVPPPKCSLAVEAGLTPRLKRGLRALRKGPVMREELDRIIGCSNSPHYVMELRHRDFDILMEEVPSIDRDGHECRPGKYTLLAEPQAEGAQ